MKHNKNWRHCRKTRNFTSNQESFSLDKEYWQMIYKFVLEACSSVLLLCTLIQQQSYPKTFI